MNGNWRVDVYSVYVWIVKKVFIARVSLRNTESIADLVQFPLVPLANGITLCLRMFLVNWYKFGAEAEPYDCNVDTMSHIFEIVIGDQLYIHLKHSIKPSLAYEKTCWRRGYRHVAGVDEAGRGCLAGPVVAAAVIFPQDFRLPDVMDSKKLSPIKREKIAVQIEESALSIGIGLCSPQEIDQKNILWAALEAMQRAVVNLHGVVPEFLLIDGNRCFPNSAWPFETIVKGDAKSFTIAAASIIAKTTRDRFMHELHEDYPDYGWNTNVGYPTPAHYKALAALGPTPFHRQTFRLK